MDITTTWRVFGLAACCIACTSLVTPGADAAQASNTGVGNLPERNEWYMDLALGMFVHWSLDSQLGSVISHSLVGSSDDYAKRYFTELPKTFEPDRFEPKRWARLARANATTRVPTGIRNCGHTTLRR